MPEFVLFTGVLIVALSGYFMLRVHAIEAIVERVFGTAWLYGAALLRLLLGAGLIASAPSVSQAALVEVLGWLFAVSGLLLVTIPQAVILRLQRRYIVTLAAWQGRLVLCFALAIGALLIWAALA